MNSLTTVKGFADLFVPESTLFSFMESTALRVFSRYGYSELRVPILEYTDLFKRSIGASTDIVQKEMFTFPDRKGRSLTLRPEATAGVMRAYIQAKCHNRESLTKFFCYGPMFRYERPQKGRMRQFHQLDCECLGAVEPEADAEMILMLMFFLRELGLSGLSLEINTLGCQECRPVYRERLQDFLSELDARELCADCQRRLDSNPLRVLDCKLASCRKLINNAPIISDAVCAQCAEHFEHVLAIITSQELAPILNPRLVRGLDYYSRTTFEVVSNSIGAQGSVAGGGRYDGLVEQLGGPAIPGIGFACGMERLALLMQQQNGTNTAPRDDFYIACLSENSPAQAIILAQELRETGLQGDCSFAIKSLKSQLRQAEKNKARFCLLLGEEEMAINSISIKNLDSGEQLTVAQTALRAWAENKQPEKH